MTIFSHKHGYIHTRLRQDVHGVCTFIYYIIANNKLTDYGPYHAIFLKKNSEKRIGKGSSIGLVQE